jgi:hypothetical protein
MGILSTEFITLMVKERERLLYGVELIDKMLKNEGEEIETEPYFLNRNKITTRIVDYLKTETEPVLMGGIRNAIAEIDDTISYSRILGAVNKCVANGTVIQIKEQGHHPLYKVPVTV